MSAYILHVDIECHTVKCNCGPERSWIGSIIFSTETIIHYLLTSVQLC